MKVLLFLSLVIASYAQTAPQWGTCTFCDLVVSSLSTYASKSVTKEDMLNALTKVSNEVCPKMPADFITPEQCASSISLYGPYTIDMILSQTSSAQICSNLKLCDSVDSEAQYNVIYPTIDEQNQQVSYTVTQKDVSVKGQKYFYRIFLGNPSFLDQETLTVQLNENENVNFELLLTNKSKFTTEVDCFAQSGSCSLLTGKPGRGVWYYIELTASSFLFPNSSEFTLTATIQNEVISDQDGVLTQHRSVHVFPIFLPVMFIALLMCCCCARRRKACKRACKRSATQEMTEVQVQEMAQMPVMGYYYAPNAFPPEYMQVPMQQVPQPIFVPIAQQE